MTWRLENLKLRFKGEGRGYQEGVSGNCGLPEEASKVEKREPKRIVRAPAGETTRALVVLVAR